MMDAFAKLTYLLAAVLFIFGLKRLSSPATARSGNWMASVGMLLAIAAVLLFEGIVEWQYILIGAVVGSAVGATFARMVKMTAMPEMVALLNGFGGGASALVASAEFSKYFQAGGDIPVNFGVAIQLSVVVGTLTFSGSLIAFGKLRELITGRAVTYFGQKTLNALILL